MMNKNKLVIPGIITSLNLFSGSIATVLALGGEIKIAVVLVVIAAVFDFIDGFVARMLDAVSEFGKQLDSLADLVSFGMAPAALLYRLAENHQLYNDYVGMFVFIIPVFSSIRLAKFNTDENQNTEFSGLPTPASALFCISVVWYCSNESNTITESILNQYFFAGMIISICILMVSKIRLFSLKISGKSSGYFWQILFLVLSVLLLITFKVLGLSFVIILYLALSIIRNLIKKNIKKQER
jgi:CDP-diacylglycerol---serine O-phosphatidyltransferase